MQQPLSIRFESMKKISLRTAEGGLQAPIYNTVAVIKILEVFLHASLCRATKMVNCKHEV